MCSWRSPRRSAVVLAIALCVCVYSYQYGIKEKKKGKKFRDRKEVKIQEAFLAGLKGLVGSGCCAAGQLDLMFELKGSCCGLHKAGCWIET